MIAVFDVASVVVDIAGKKVTKKVKLKLKRGEEEEENSNRKHNP